MWTERVRQGSPCSGHAEREGVLPDWAEWMNGSFFDEEEGFAKVLLKERKKNKGYLGRGKEARWLRDGAGGTWDRWV